ncbi:MAG: hypothetical protein DRJ42_07030 [Deltaproteobacteria bacterium]|nr:MAG: hypothetical protein DRJ42_07030 [Deltaproteobacteria bacterium]
MKKYIGIAGIALALAGIGAPTLGSAQEGQEGQERQEAAAEVRGPERYAGTYRFSQSRSTGQEIINQAIERDTEDLNFVIRGIARGKLEGKNPIVSTIDIAVRDGNIVIRLDGRRYTAPADGTRTTAIDPAGDEVGLTHAYRDGKIIQTFLFDGGQRRNVFSLRRSGILQYNVIVTADRLPGPVRYGLHYRPTH